ncbi:MAG TPA: alpha/beta hydrolase [Roseiarcus sp.]|jgi:pimeloyl-ACP methyl ester carboxylesterase|nr:alpha/beta hydrolase [Roseiarcus sp.]
MPRVRANGIDVEYESFGREDDPLVLLIMGLAAQLLFWPEPLCEGLAAKGFRVVRFDNRDIGKSTHLSDGGTPNIPELLKRAASGLRLETPYTLADMAEDAVGLISALGAGRAHVVGASMGGMIAQLVAINHPDRTKSLTSIMSTTGRRDLPPGDSETLAALTRPPKSLRREDLIEHGLLVRHALASPGFPASEADNRAFVERVVDRAPYDPGGIVRQLAAVIAASPRNELLKAVRRPALVLHGDSDPLFPVAAAKDTAESIPGAELVAVPGMSHSLPESLAPLCLKHLADFLARVEARANAPVFLDGGEQTEFAPQ